MIHQNFQKCEQCNVQYVQNLRTVSFTTQTTADNSIFNTGILNY